jgi:hypothetical protein
MPDAFSTASCTSPSAIMAHALNELVPQSMPISEARVIRSNPAAVANCAAGAGKQERLGQQ